MNAVPLRTLTPSLSVAPQLSPEAMAEVARLGFKSVINNRPDFEAGPTQPTSAQIEAAAQEAGLAYRYQPVGPAYQSPAEVEAFAALLQELPGPVLAFCRSGTRSAKLYVAGMDR